MIAKPVRSGMNQFRSLQAKGLILISVNTAGLKGWIRAKGLDHIKKSGLDEFCGC